MNKEQFIFPSIQIRSTLNVDKQKVVVVKGYAVAPNIPHDYMKEVDASGIVVKTFKSLFTDNFVNSMKEQMSYAPIFVDALHQTAANINIRTTLDNIKTKAIKSGIIFDEEVDAIMANLKASQFPLGKPINFNIDDNGMFVEIELNPEFRKVDSDHQRYYDAVVGSLQNGNLNTMSINFMGTDVVEQDGLERINDGKFYGISFMPDGALRESSSITEVAIRSIMEVRSTMENQGNPQGNTQQKDNTPPAQTPQNSNDSDLEKKYAEAQAELNAMKAEQENQRQKEEYNKQMDAMKKEILESFQASDGPKGVVKTKNETKSASTIKTPEEWIEKVKSLAWKEKIQLQAELGGAPYGVDQDAAERMGALKKDADMNFNK